MKMEKTTGRGWVIGIHAWEGLNGVGQGLERHGEAGNKKRVDPT
jgi:hypothetical protein